MLLEQQSACVVNGIGGIGKTSLAEAYIEAYYGDYAHIAWVTQESHDLVQSFLTATTLQSNLGIPDAFTDQQQRFAETLNRMKALDGSPCLLVLDNAEESVSNHLDALPKGPQWHLLLTSRHSIGSISELELDKLEPEAALDLFKSHCPDFKDDAAVLDLLKQVEYHTLTVEILAKTANRRSSSRDQLLNALKEDWKVMVSVNRGKNKVKRVMSYLTSIFKVQGKLSEEETWLLTQFTCFPSDYLSVDTIAELVSGYRDRKKQPVASRPNWFDRLFRRGKAKSVPESSTPNPLEALWQSQNFPGELEVILNRLVDTGWLQKGEDRRFRLHRVVGDVLWTQFAPTVEEMEGLIGRVDDLLYINQTKDNPVDKFPFIPFGQAMLDRFPKEKHDLIAGIQYVLATVFQHSGKYLEAKRLFESVVLTHEQIHGPDHEKTAAAHSNLALVLQDLGDYAGAKVLMEKAVAAAEKYYGPQHPQTVIYISNMALVLQDLNNFVGAKGLLDKAIAADERNFGTEHPTTAISYSNMALVLKDLGDYAGSKELLEKAVAAAETNYGPQHPQTTIYISNLATVLKDLAEYVLAKELLEKAVAADERNFGTKHPTTARRYNNLAGVLVDMEEYEQALLLYKKALVIFRKVLPEGHPNIVVVEGNLQRLLSKIQS